MNLWLSTYSGESAMPHNVSKPSGLLAALLCLALVCAPAAFAESDDLGALKNEIESLKKGQEGMMKDLDEIKKLIKAMPKPSQPEGFKPVDVKVEGSPFKGKADAPVTLVEFTDYQCPFCKRHATQTMPQIVKDYVETGKVKYVLREFPIRSLHPNAIKASGAALCAGDQGKYWEMHDRIFDEPKKLEPADLTAHAEALSLDTAAFQACIDSDKYGKQINADINDGSKAGVRGTPSFLLGRTDTGDLKKVHATEFLRGAQPYPQFKSAIDKLLAAEK